MPKTAKATRPEDVFAACETPNYRYMVDAADRQREWEKRLKWFEDNASPARNGTFPARTCRAHEWH